jgi:hypothetical protein
MGWASGIPETSRHSWPTAGYLVPAKPWQKATSISPQYLKSGINDTYLVGVLRGYDTTLIRSRAERAKLDWDFDRIVAQAKSAAVMHMLGGILGEDKLQETAQGILKTNKQLIITDRDFQKLSQAATSAKLEGFFDQWLRTKDYLDYYMSHVRTNKTDAGWEVHSASGRQVAHARYCRRPRGRESVRFSQPTGARVDGHPAEGTACFDRPGSPTGLPLLARVGSVAGSTWPNPSWSRESCCVTGR